MKVAYLTNSSPLSGVGHRAKNILQSVTQYSNNIELVEFNLDGKRGLLSKNGKPVSWINKWPGFLGNKSIGWVRLGKRLVKYINNKEKNNYQLFHATNQTLSWLVKYLQPMVVTVHDLIELTDPQDKKAALVNRYLIGELRKASHIIAVSNYTAGQIKKFADINEDKITIIHNGVGSEFHQIDDFSHSIANVEIRRELKINESTKIVMFVGSDHPRKNVSGALEVFRLIKEQEKDVIFIKVGEPGILIERGKLLDKANEMKIRDSVRFVGSISDEKLNIMYNMSDVLLYPSKNEGFGLPLVQAMACALPIVAANTTAIPEIVGDSGILLNVEDTTAMAKNCLTIMQDENIAGDLRKKGLKRIEMFSWDKAADKTTRVYDQAAADFNK